ncbi:MAG TPA: terminase family protein, partial [Allosphingosinicella sp.]|nr:terminase family protein [Allosphingosinicella sp.]
MEHGQHLLRRMRVLAPEDRRLALDGATEAEVRKFDRHWPAWAHPGQVPPHDDWLVWVMLAGRGFGKTRAGAEWISGLARAAPGARIALVAATPEEARRVMIEGRSGLLAVARSGEERERLVWEPSRGRIGFASGAEAFVYSGAHPDGLRGPEHHFAWCDELAKWKRPREGWDNLQLGLRLGDRPRALVTTTPRPVAALKAILALEGTVLTGGATRANPHLPDAFVRAVEAIHAGTRLGRQELDGKLIEDFEGALWTRDLIESSRIRLPHPDLSAEGLLKRVIVGVDPPASSGGDECGIVAVGLGADGIGYVLADHSAGGLSPDGWGRRVAAAAEAHGAHRVVAESNNGGEMIRSVLAGA